jgi:hypothetical protein
MTPCQTSGPRNCASRYASSASFCGCERINAPSTSRFLVALPAVQDLFISAKYLFFDALVTTDSRQELRQSPNLLLRVISAKSAARAALPRAASNSCALMSATWLSPLPEVRVKNSGGGCASSGAAQRPVARDFGAPLVRARCASPWDLGCDNLTSLGFPIPTRSDRPFSAGDTGHWEASLLALMKAWPCGAGQ